MADTPANITGEDVSLAEQAWVNAPDAHGHLVGCCRLR